MQKSTARIATAMPLISAIVKETWTVRPPTAETTETAIEHILKHGAVVETSAYLPGASRPSAIIKAAANSVIPML